MCYVRKFVFSCSHLSHWGKPVRKCPQQKAFQKGKDEECFEKWASLFTTYALPDPCPNCAVRRKAEEEERDARIEKWKKKDEEANKRFEEGGKKREVMLTNFREKLEEAKKGLEKVKKTKKSGEGKSSKSPTKNKTSKDDDSDDEASVKKNESWDDVEVMIPSRGRSPTPRSTNSTYTATKSSLAFSPFPFVLTF